MALLFDHSQRFTIFHLISLALVCDTPRLVWQSRAGYNNQNICTVIAWANMIPQPIDLTAKTFLEGPAGSGKTTHATRYLLSLLENGVDPDRIMVLVPQATYGRPYQLTVYESQAAGGIVQITTLAGIARRAIETS